MDRVCWAPQAPRNWEKSWFTVGTSVELQYYNPGPLLQGWRGWFPSGRRWVSLFLTLLVARQTDRCPVVIEAGWSAADRAPFHTPIVMPWRMPEKLETSPAVGSLA